MNVTFRLDGVPLTSDYDEAADVLYLWVDEPVPAVTYETEQGHLVHLDPETKEFVGATILDFKERWEAEGSISIDVPLIEHRVLEPA